jgi:anti-sigma-K factor RskA
MTGPGPIQDMTCDEIRDVAGAFVLGALSPAEADAVRAHLDSCDDAHAEIRELGGVLPVLNESVPFVEPAAGLKSRIMAAAAADLAAREGDESTTAGSMTSGAAAPEPTPFPTTSKREARRRTSAGTWVLRIAAVLAIVLLGGWNLLLQGQLDAAKTYEQSVAAVLDVAAQPGSTTAILTTAGGSGGSGLAAISSSGQVTIAMQDLAPTSGSTVYTAWVIAGDGVPVPLGDFTVGSGGTGSLEASGAPSTPGVVLALTLEPQSGATTPTLPIISKGVATGAG